ncbi:MAG: hypothetical protein LBV46_03745 [Bacteroidales bacterium]|jgi:nitrite reductase/ring-hydroxylating ferredoxin subunit|nr:hypothetical protein [Bacteroidales bacterium]
MKLTRKINFEKSFLWLLLVATAGCGPVNHPVIPNTAVDFSIYIYDINYSPLLNYGGHVYVTGGIEGIILYRVDEMTIMAYDRACPYDWDDGQSWLEMEESNLLITDKHCGSLFNVLDGSVVKGPAKYPLKYYRTQFDGNRLRVYN